MENREADNRDICWSNFPPGSPGEMFIHKSFECALCTRLSRSVFRRWSNSYSFLLHLESNTHTRIRWPRVRFLLGRVNLAIIGKSLTQNRTNAKCEGFPRDLFNAYFVFSPPTCEYDYFNIFTFNSFLPFWFSVHRSLSYFPHYCLRLASIE